MRNEQSNFNGSQLRKGQVHDDFNESASPLTHKHHNIRPRHRIEIFKIFFLSLLFLRYCNGIAWNTQIQSIWKHRIHEPRLNNKPLINIRGGDNGRRKRNKENLPLQEATLKENIKSSKSNVENTSVDTAPPLNLIRFLFLSFYASLGSLLPYLPVYYHSLGHTGLAIGLLGSVKPLTTFLVAPIWGIVSDQSKSPHFILQLTFLSGLILQLSSAFNDSLYWLIGTVFLCSIMTAPIKSLMDCMVMNTLPPQSKGEYGKLRLWGQLGFGLGSSLVGMSLNRIPKTSEVDVYVKKGDMWEIFRIFWWQITHGYKLAFVSHALISIPCFICMKALQRYDLESHIVEEKSSKQQQQPQKPKTDILHGINLLLHNPDAILFFFLVFVIGVSSGIIENFAYVRMREVGGTGREMGISRLVSSAAGAPMFWFSGTIAQKLGVDKVLVLSLLSYVTRFLIYAFMRRPLEGLTAEALRGLTFAAFWSTGTIYAHKISPKGMSATMLMFLNAMYGGIGQSLGAIIGGKLQHKVGTVKTFVYSAIFDLCFVGGVIAYLTVLKTDSSFHNPQQIGLRSSDNVSIRGRAILKNNKKILK